MGTSERYAGVPQCTLSADSFAGTWEHLPLIYKTTGNYISRSEYLTISGDGTFNDNPANIWTFNGDTLLLSWNTGVSQKLIVFWGWDWEYNCKTLLYTGMDNEGSCIWGKKINQPDIDRYTKLIEGATYSIRNFRSHLLMHVPNEDDNPGTLIAQGADNGQSSQLWKIKKTDDSYYYLFPHHGQDKLVIEVKDGATGNRTNLIINRLSGADKQKFFIYYNKDGSFRIMTKVSNIESGVDVSDAAVYEGASVVQYTYIARLSQFWRFEKIDTIPVDTTPIDSFDFVSVRTADLTKINIYPNPSSNGKVTIDISSLYDNNDINISVFDLRGIMVFNKELLKSDTDKYVLELPSGIYIIRINSGMDQYLKKIIIQ